MNQPKELQANIKDKNGDQAVPCILMHAWMKEPDKKQIHLHHKSQFRASNKLSLHIYRAFMFQLKIIYFRTCGSLSSGTILAARRSLFCSVCSFGIFWCPCTSWGPGMVLSYSHQLHLLHHVLYSHALSYLNVLSCLLCIQAASTNPLLQRTAFSGTSCTVRLPVSGCLSVCLQYHCLEWQ